MVLLIWAVGLVDFCGPFVKQSPSADEDDWFDQQILVDKLAELLLDF